jgi:hypothetical protein
MQTARTGRTHGCTGPSLQVTKVLANPEPSTHGTFRTLRAGAGMSAVEGKKRTSAGQYSTSANGPKKEEAHSDVHRRCGFLFGCDGPLMRARGIETLDIDAVSNTRRSATKLRLRGCLMVRIRSWLRSWNRPPCNAARPATGTAAVSGRPRWAVLPAVRQR